ncbi:MAG TPA: class I SAM-dependent methyltransferase [Thermoplasmata archaeon]|nr:class I SAM-dependent methyltransferase [Thermoplasmata archaeon]
MSSPPTGGTHESRFSAQDYAQAIRADYIAGETPWDTGVPNPELIRVVEKGGFPGTAVLEMGCGTGTNSVELARRGYRVTSVDLADVAIFKAREKAKSAGVNVDFRVGDLTQTELGGPYDCLLDIGVYHGIRNRDLTGFLRAVVRLSRPGTRWLCIAGSANSPQRDGPPMVREEEFRAELGSAFKILDAHEFTYLELAPNFRPPFWSILMERR